mmetsp:Transcript_15467/g.36558  ORF Transcript_15467/g.36558 Transcript_15467/m.36558 type:complete len:246 (-) Transcript_15467:978-1715(-)
MPSTLSSLVSSMEKDNARDLSIGGRERGEVLPPVFGDAGGLGEPTAPLDEAWLARRKEPLEDSGGGCAAVAGLTAATASREARRSPSAAVPGRTAAVVMGRSVSEGARVRGEALGLGGGIGERPLVGGVSGERPPRGEWPARSAKEGASGRREGERPVLMGEEARGARLAVPGRSGDRAVRLVEKTLAVPGLSIEGLSVRGPPVAGAWLSERGLSVKAPEVLGRSVIRSLKRAGGRLANPHSPTV